MRRLCEMTREERAYYMQKLAEATDSVTPEGSIFVVVVVDETGQKAEYVGNGTLPDMANILENTARTIRRDDAVERAERN